MPRPKKERDHGGGLCNKLVACAYCRRPDGSVVTFKARDALNHYIREHGSFTGAFACGVLNCTFRCPKGGACISRHISRKHADVADVFYTYVPNITEFGVRQENMPCSPCCAGETDLAM